MDCAMQPIIVYLQDTIRPLCTITACRLEAAWIDKECRADCMADGKVGVPVYYTVGLRKESEHPVLYIVAVAGAMADTYSVSVLNERTIFR